MEDPGVKRRATVTSNTKQSKKLRTERSRTSTEAVDKAAPIVEEGKSESAVV